MKFSFAEIFRKIIKRFAVFKKEHHNITDIGVIFFSDNTEDFPVMRCGSDSAFFISFANSTFKRRLGRFGFKFSARGRKEAFIGLLGSFEQQEIAFGVFNIEKYSQFQASERKKEQGSII